MVGINLAIGISVNKAITPKDKKGKCQSDRVAKYNPKGTPTTEAKEKEAITKPIAPALRSFGTASPMIDKIKALRIPPNEPVNALVKSNI